jgi:hypothetical protein
VCSLQNKPPCPAPVSSTTGTTATGLHASCRSRGLENRDVRAFRGRRVCEISLFPPEEKAGRPPAGEEAEGRTGEKRSFCKYLDRDY